MLNPLSPALQPAPSCAFTRIEAAVGNTPLAHIRLSFRGRPIEIFAKAEMYNLSGSIKDRMALNILRRARASDALRPGQPIAEATSGNAGIAIAAIGCALGHPVTIFMPDWMSIERRQLIASYGAEVRLVSREEGGFLGSIAAAEKLGADEGYFLPRQFCNEDNCCAHASGTLPETWAQMERVGARLSGFVAGVGTGGTVMGAMRFLREKDATIPVHPVEPASSPTLSTGHKVGQHRMQGISDEFIPDIVKVDQLDPIIAVEDGDAILMAQRIGRELGLGVGISSGGNILAAVLAADMQQGETKIATVLADNHMKYLSTDLMREEPVKPGYLTPDITLDELTMIPG
ncbi:MAG: PLP-dependent cysteine synthase family protein [Sphingomonadaceae bacterium]|nr:PLP-dependent cysteine synthase family protein [Sphingomonadaceae bacterium]MCP5383015.1 PLP-dependent cysteine synthase family protein [Altererythrobacter sp.]MCP5391136.1 PLP-dependent cysteine synthase family protein [Sphingomonadaceae bacterium]MCP5393197.1 PLP-dependent cysteine synthase family protein [Sphingomonadaceae bacterium]